MQLEIISSMAQLDARDWNNLFNSDYPFCQYEFLHALEQGASIGENSGWLVQHLVLRHDQQLIAIMPAYIKLHSYGEYLFDWQFAKAYHHSGFEFYPKLVNAIPFTPAQGPRFAVASNYDKASVLAILTQGIEQLSEQFGFSQFQALYPEPAEQKLYRQLGYQERLDVQFQWHNKNYTDFDHFLQHLTARKRKQIKQERAKVAKQNISINTLTNEQLTPQIWQLFYQFYSATYQKRSGHQGYLSQATFIGWGQTMADKIVLFVAEYEGEIVAASLCFKDNSHLYGRYWGAKAEFDRLHFECCYYAGIEYCIERQLQVFDAGAQGEHKIQRGFEPVIRSGFYQFQPNALTPAITNYIAQERAAVTDYYQQVKQKLPFKVQ
ncbi:GNAT family N-acetyltransferase [Rheinheimera sp. WS51]|uniref:GNAT family N-acetyltransferase n=1 Tax=Rheinheimera sp. WS51 TaxID=3425886 RepID=UPI003D8A8F7C